MTKRTRPLAFAALLAVALSAMSCGASAPKRSYSSYEAAASPSYGGGMAKTASVGYDEEYEMDGLSDDADSYAMPASEPMEAGYAMAEHAPAAPGPGSYAGQPATGGEVMAVLEVPADLEGVKWAQADKATEKPDPAAGDMPAKAPDRLILYTAEMGLAVFRVDEKIEEIRKNIKTWGGYMVSMDSNRIVFRVPAETFEDALEELSGIGDVTYRNIQGTDVTEEFRDLKIRLENAEAVRDRLLELLSQTKNINESLQVEHELERITEKIELMKGRLKYLKEAALYSKITVHLAVKTKAKKPIPPIYAPFKWIQDIGLDSLFSF